LLKKNSKLAINRKLPLNDSQINSNEKRNTIDRIDENESEN